MPNLRVWLTAWEWACCGDPFTVGDRVTLNVQRPPGAWPADTLGPELGLTVDAEETHHVEPGPERLTGTVTAIQGVTIEHDVRRERRENPAPPPEPLRLGKGVWASAGASDPYYTVSTPIPGTGALHPAPRVPWPPRYNEPGAEEARGPRFEGYLVDLTTD